MAEEETLYICRPIVNTKDIIEWAESQNIQVTIPEDELHTTIVFSKVPKEWGLLGAPQDNELVIPEGGERSAAAFGEAGVIVFASYTLANRNAESQNLGFSWEHEGYIPHVSFCYEGADKIDFSSIEPYTGQIVLGPEQFSPVKAEYLEENFLELFDKAYR